MTNMPLPPGPWTDEPDRVDFEMHGYPCIIRRVDSGHLCGYVGVPPGHPWHGHEMFTIDADVHGGITYADMCHGAVCHVAKPGEPEDVYWLGFDCAHVGDLSPGRVGAFSEFLSEGTVYRTVEYVRDQCEQLALQAKAAA